MRKIARFIVNNKVVILIVFVVLTVFVALLTPLVKVNYNDMIYLPKKSEMKQGIDDMYSSFGDGGNVTIMIEDVSIAEAVRRKDKMASVTARRKKDGKLLSYETVDAISDIIWIDSLILSKEFGLTSAVKSKEYFDSDAKDKDKFYTNVEMVAYVYEVGRLIASGKVPLPKIDMGKPLEALATINAFKSTLMLHMQTEEFRASVLKENPTEKPEFFDRLFEADNIRTENKFINNIFPKLMGSMGAIFMEAPPSIGESASSLELSTLTEQLNMFWSPNTGKAGEANSGGSALYQVMFNYSDYDDATAHAISTIRKMKVGAKIIGNAATVSNNIESVQKITFTSMAIAVAIVIVILLFTTSSYWEPVILIAVMGAAILLNMGSNIIMGKNGISYMTQGVASVLQLALTMDYSIYLLNRFKQEKSKGLTSNEAMVEALMRSFSPVSSSSLTTMASFVALCFMSYKMGLDMGLVLMKGVFFSILAVFVLMPPLILVSEKLIYKTAHKTINLTFKRFSKFLIKTRFYLPLLIIALIIPSGIYQKQNKFSYGQEASLEGPLTAIRLDKNDIERKFGKQNQVVLILPEDPEFTQKKINVSSNPEKPEYISIETYLSNQLIKIPITNDSNSILVIKAQSYQEIIDAGGGAVMPAKLKSQFIRTNAEGKHVVYDKDNIEYVVENDQYIENYGKPNAARYSYQKTSADATSNYAFVLVSKDGEPILQANKIQTKDIKISTHRRLVMFLPLAQEGEKTTKAVMDIDNIISSTYKEAMNKTGLSVKVIGQAPAALEIKKIVDADYDIIQYISIGLVALVLLLAFKSLLLPILMILVIQSSIYLNMVIPFMQGERIVFIGYLIVSNILLGATIDYAIVLVAHYVEYREKCNKFDSMQQALASSARTLLTSGGILIFAGFAANFANKSTSPATAMFGSTIMRGGIASLALVFILLPQLLLIFDSLIRKTMYKGKSVMIDNALAKAAQDVEEQGLTKKVNIKRKLTKQQRGDAIINSILRGIRDENYDPDSFTYEDALENMSAKGLEDDAQKDDAELTQSTNIDMFKTLSDSLKADADAYQGEYLTREEIADLSEADKKSTPQDVALPKESTDITTPLSNKETAPKESFYSEIYDTIEHNKPATRFSRGTTRSSRNPGRNLKQVIEGRVVPTSSKKKPAAKKKTTSPKSPRTKPTKPKNNS